MKYKITAAEYAALPDDTRAHYGSANGEGLHVLRLEGVDVAGLQAKVDEFRTTNTAVMRERDALTEKLKPFEGLDPAAARTAIAEVAKLQAAAGGKPNATAEEAIAAAVAAAVASAVAPLQATVASITEQKTAAERAAAEARFASAVDAAALEAGVRRGSLPDVRNRATAAGFGLTPEGRVIQQKGGVPVYVEGAEVEVSRWLTTSLRKDADWFFEPNGGGASHGSGPTSTATRVLENPSALEFGANAADIASGKVDVNVPALSGR